MRISDWSSDVCSSDLGKRTVREIADPLIPPDDIQNVAIEPHGHLGDKLVHAVRRDRRIRLRIGRLLHHQHPVEQRSGMAAARVEEAGEQRIQITRVAKLAHDPAQFDLEPDRSEEHTSELQSLMRISYAVFCLKKKIN